jgi:hypothetical protein
MLLLSPHRANSGDPRIGAPSRLVILLAPLCPVWFPFAGCLYSTRPYSGWFRQERDGNGQDGHGAT